MGCCGDTSDKFALKKKALQPNRPEGLCLPSELLWDSVCRGPADGSYWTTGRYNLDRYEILTPKAQ